MKYTEEIWSDLTYEEKQIYHLYEVFQQATKKRGQREVWLPQASAKSWYDYDRDEKYPGDKIREAKNWPYFEEAYETYKDDQFFDPEVFIEAIFKRLINKDKIYPAQLKTKTNKQYYKDYRMKLKMTSTVSDTKKMMIDIGETYKFILRKLNKKELFMNDLQSFFNNAKDKNIVSEGIFHCINEMISPFYLVISKSFEDAYFKLDKDIQEEIMNMDDFYNVRGLVKLKTRVYEFAKKLFKEDII